MKGVSEKDREEPITEWREDEKRRSMLRREAHSHTEEELPARLWEGLWKELLPLQMKRWREKHAFVFTCS